MGSIASAGGTSGLAARMLGVVLQIWCLQYRQVLEGRELDSVLWQKQALFQRDRRTRGQEYN